MFYDRITETAEVERNRQAILGAANNTIVRPQQRFSADVPFQQFFAHH